MQRYLFKIMLDQLTICAIATSPGMGAIATIRLSGEKAIEIADSVFQSPRSDKKLINQQPNTLHFGTIADGNELIDEVVVSVFKSPHSFTGEDVIEITCHGSTYIQQRILQLLISKGARMALPGEFTQRAFLNGKMDLSQAEAVADLIASTNRAAQKVAINQMRGGFSSELANLRSELLNFISLIELELDFSEEDVEFANRTDLKNLVITINSVIQKLLHSFEVGNVIKNGIPVAIVGRPNAGKSTLLNVLLDDERAIVSEIPGTTRDTIEDEMIIDGVLFRFIDTAGLRTTTDIIEQIGVNKALEVIKKSAIIIYVFDSHTLSCGDLKLEIELLKEYIGTSQLVIVANKMDVENYSDLREEFSEYPDIVYISAKENRNIDLLQKTLLKLFDTRTLDVSDTIVTNARHANSLRNAGHALDNVAKGLDENIASDLLALDIRYALEELGNITGQVTNEDLLENIFTRFCIGK